MMKNPLKRQWFTVRDARGNSPEKDDYVPDEESRKKGLVLVAIVVAIMLAILIVIGKQLLSVASDPESLEAYLDSWGMWGVLVFMVLVILQIVAAIVPGGPFEIAAGYLYGAFWGSVICDIAMTIGSVLVFMLTRKVGMKFVRMFFTKEQIDSVGWLHTSQKKNLILFVFFLIPGTPKDLLSYVVGLTDVPLKTWIFITAVGRFPAIYLSALSGTALENDNYAIFIAMIVVILLLTVVGTLLYNKKTGQKNKTQENGK